MKHYKSFATPHNILIAVDDIQQGLGRTGKWSSVDHYHFTPDLMTFGKSLAGGLPMSAIVGRKEIMESLEAPAHLFTTGANPVSEAALATIKMIEDEDLLKRFMEKGVTLEKNRPMDRTLPICRMFEVLIIN